MKGPIQDFNNGIVELEDVVVELCTGVVGLFAGAKPMLDPSVDGKRNLAAKISLRAI